MLRRDHRPRSRTRRLLALAASCSLALGLGACDGSAVEPDGGRDTGGSDTGIDGPGADTGEDRSSPGDGGPDADTLVGLDTADSSTTTVETEQGVVEGALKGTTAVFLGIPYAAPPVGPLRWKPPQPPAAQSGPLQATQRGPACPQFALGSSDAISPSSDEDCLQLNVWVPASEKKTPRPVMLWLHGGGFTIGSATDPYYDGRRLAEVTGHLVVGINYRLGPLGFLALDDLDTEDEAHPSSGNYGLEDQRAALDWVKRNIAVFGGDPAQVTLFGESAGGTSVCHHILSPLSAGLFQRAIIESGPCDGEVFSNAAGKAQGEAFVAALGCDTDEDPLACLRAKSVQEVLTALGSGVLGVSGEDGVWQPVVDGLNLPDHPRTLLDDGDISQAVPVLLGNNKNEGTIFTAAITDEASYQAATRAMLGDGLADDALAQYPAASFDTAAAAAAELLGDAIFVCTARRMARAFSSNGQSTFRYAFDYAYVSPIFPGAGSFHSAEIPFVFGNSFVLHDISPEEQPLSDAMMAYWGRFAAAGDPNGGEDPAWPAYDPDTDPYLALDLPISAGAGLKTAICDFWDTHPLPQ